MAKFKNDLKAQVRVLRSFGKTYSEINFLIKLRVSKSTLSSWCKGVPLPSAYSKKIKKLNFISLKKARVRALQANSVKRKNYLSSLEKGNFDIAAQVIGKDVAKIALAMLCLGEASKYGSSSFALGNTNPKIIIIFLQLLKMSSNFKESKLRCTVQCRADQNVSYLENYWCEVTGIPLSQFYKAQIDPRTINRPTKKPEYKGVLRINYLDSNIQQDLESLSSLIYNQLALLGPVV